VCSRALVETAAESRPFASPFPNTHPTTHHTHTNHLSSTPNPTHPSTPNHPTPHPYPPNPPTHAPLPQAHSSLKTIRKKLVRKVLDYIKKMADDEVKCKEGDEKKGGGEGLGIGGGVW